jgi:hypothetical protein
MHCNITLNCLQNLHAAVEVDVNDAVAIRIKADAGIDGGIALLRDAVATAVEKCEEHNYMVIVRHAEAWQGQLLLSTSTECHASLNH